MPNWKGYNGIVAAKDDLTGISEAKAIKDKTSHTLAAFLMELICRYGIMGQVTTDNGPEVRDAFALLVKKMGIPHITITPYNKHTNGKVERGHYTLREAIVRSCPRDEDGNIIDWVSRLPLALLADRVTVSSVTGFLPFYLLHGVDPVLPFDLMEATLLVDGFKPDMTTEDLLALRIRQLEKREADMEKAKQTLIKAKLYSKQKFIERYRKRLPAGDCNPGDLVLVQDTSRESTVRRYKVLPRYFGPFVVIKRTPLGNYILRECNGAKWSDPVAKFRVIRYVGRNNPELYALHSNKPLELLDGNEDDDMSSETNSDHSEYMDEGK